jgi:ABC-2 type transport system permease protein
VIHSPTVATAQRVLSQLRRDPRTVALLLAIPIVLLALMKWVFDDRPEVFQRVGVPLLGFFPLTSMFVVTSITVLRERTSGTLERLMAMPIAKLDLLLGYAIAFGAFAALQAMLAATAAFGLLGLETNGHEVAVIVLTVLNALLGMSMGLFLSAFARSEFQAVQFLPAFLLPQFLLSGVLGPRDHMARFLEIASDFLPLTYAYDSLQRLAVEEVATRRLTLDVSVVAGATVLALVLGAATLRRRTG